MDLEVQSVPKEHKTKLQIKVRSYKGELGRHRAEVVRQAIILYSLGCMSDVLLSEIFAFVK